MSDTMIAPSPSPEQTPQPSTQPEEHKNLWGYIADVADFLFATKSLGRLVTGQASWGDAAAIGITAASFFIPPARLLKFAAKPLESVVAHAAEIVASDTASIAAKRAAERTAENAKFLLDNPEKHQALLKAIDTSSEPVALQLSDLSKQADGFLNTGVVPELRPYTVSEISNPDLIRPPQQYPKSYEVIDRTEPTPAALAERSGKVRTNKEGQAASTIDSRIASGEVNLSSRNQYEYITDEEFDWLVKNGVDEEYLTELNNYKRIIQNIQSKIEDISLPENTMVIDGQPLGTPKIKGQPTAFEIANNEAELDAARLNYMKTVNELAKEQGLKPIYDIEEELANIGYKNKDIKNLERAVKLRSKAVFAPSSEYEMQKIISSHEGTKIVMDALEKKMPSEFPSRSALGPEIEQLENDIYILQNFKVIEAGDTKQSDKLIRIFEERLQQEPEGAFKNKLEILVEDLKQNDTKSEFFDRLNATLRTKVSRLSQLKEAVDDPLGSISQRQTKEYIPVTKGDTGKIDYVAPRIYSDKPGSMTAYDAIELGMPKSSFMGASETATLSELKAEEKSIMDRLAANGRTDTSVYAKVKKLEAKIKQAKTEDIRKALIKQRQDLLKQQQQLVGPDARARLRKALSDVRQEIFLKEVSAAKEFFNTAHKKFAKDLTLTADKESIKKVRQAIHFARIQIDHMDNNLSGLTSSDINKQLKAMQTVRLGIPDKNPIYRQLLQELDDTAKTLTKYRNKGKYRTNTITKTKLETQQRAARAAEPTATKELSKEERMAATKAKVDELVKSKSAETVTDKPVNKAADDEILVFGSNLEGRHGKGAALEAKEKFGAKYGQARGRQGQSYAIPTKDLKTNKGLPLDSIKKDIDEFLDYAEAHPDEKFFFSAIGTGLAGHSPEDIASLISKTPSNVRFDPKIGNLIKSTTKPTSDIVVHSGLATGADTAWAKAADEAGIKTVGHSFKGHSGPGTRPKLEVRNELSESQLKEADVHLKKANEVLKRPTGNMSEFVRNLLRRNYYQIKDSEAVIAISKILPGGKIVDGGTGWAVQMGIDMNKAVYVFDQEVNAWAKWNGERFIKSDLPPNFKSFAGIGSRNLKPSGRKAIQDYIESLVKGK